MEKTTHTTARRLKPALLFSVSLSLLSGFSYGAGPSLVQDFGSAAVNGPGVSATVAFSLSGLSAAPSVSIGGVDFTSGALSCNTNDTACSAVVTFSPKFAGLKQDALLLKNSAGHLVASAFLHGIGTGAALRAFPATISTAAGNGSWNYVDGPGASASFRNPQGVALDLHGNVYVADSINQVIREIAAGSAVVSTVAGDGGAGYSGDGGPALSATLNTPTGIALDAAGNLFIADQQNGLIRRVDAVSQIITTVAGGGNSTANGVPGTTAALLGPTDVAVDTAGNVYIADSFHNLVRKLAAATGLIATFAGGGTAAGTDGLGDGGLATAAQLNNPTGIVLDSAGDLFLADTGDSMIRRVDAVSGNITAVAGNGSNGSAGDGGLATDAELGSPTGVCVDASGNLYIVDFARSVVRLVYSKTGIIATFAGNGIAAYTGDGHVAISASLNNPADLALDSAGDLLIADYANNVVRKVTFQPPLLAFPATDVSLTSGLVEVQLSNFGNANLNLSSLSVSPAFGQKQSGETDCTATSALEAGTSCVTEMAFVPTVVGAVTGTLHVVSNSGNQSGTQLAVNLSGTGLSGAPVVTLSPASVTFSTQAVGSTSSRHVVTMQNSGTAALSSISISVAGLNPPDFPISSTCSTTLAAGASCTIGVTFAPLLAGARSASLTIFDIAANSPQSVALTGTGSGGPMPALSPTVLQFGSEAVAKPSAVKTVDLTNSGVSSLSIYGISVSGTNGADFPVAGTTCMSSLAAASSCTISLSFNPSATGTRSATLMVTQSAGNSQAALAGTGVVAGPVPAISATSLQFGSETVGYSIGAQTVTLSNVSTGAIPIGNISMSGANVADFQIDTSTCGTSLSASSVCSVVMSFLPSAPAARSASLVFTYSAGNSQSVTLSGTGVNGVMQGVEANSSLVAVSNGVTYVATDQTIHQTYVSNGQWVDFNVMAGSGTTTRVEGGSSLVVISNGVTFIATDQTIHQTYVSNGQWVDFDVMAGSGTASRVEEGSSLTVVSGGITYVATDQTIHQTYVSGGRWVDFNVMAGSGTATRVEAGSRLVVVSNGVTFIATDQTIHQTYVSNGQWVDFDVMAGSGTTSRVEEGSSLTVAGGGITYLATDQTIHQAYVSGGQWVDFNVMGGSGTATRVEAGSGLVVVSDGITYIATDQTIHQTYVSNGQWVDFNVMAGSGSASRVEEQSSLTGVSGGITYVATDQTIHQAYVSNGRWVDFNVMGGSGTASRLEAGSNLELVSAGFTYVAADLTIHQAYVSNGQWVDFRI